MDKITKWRLEELRDKGRYCGSRTIPELDALVDCYERVNYPAALTPAEKGPTCPKCGRPLLNNTTTWWCQNGPCSWQQFDKAQRPKDWDGWHAGDHRYALLVGEKYFTEGHVRTFAGETLPTSGVWIAVPDAPVVEVQYNGQTIGTMTNGIKDKSSPLSKITVVAVKDAPVSEPVLSCCQCNWSNTGLLNMAQEPGYAPELWCHGCLQRLVNAHRDETGKFIKLNETPPAPRLRCYRSKKTTPPWMVKVFNGIVVETLNMSGSSAQGGWTYLFNAECDEEITPADYESARKPAKPAIEPMNDKHKSECRTCWMLCCILAQMCDGDPAIVVNLLTGYLWDEEEAGQIKVNALEGGGGK